MPFSEPAGKRWWIVLLVGVVLADLVEYLTSYLMEKLFHARWWDYSHMRFNFKGLICLRNTLFFAAAGFVIVTIIEPKVEEFIDSLVINVGLIIMLVLSAMLLIDTLLSLFKARKMRRLSSDYEPTLIFKSHR